MATLSPETLSPLPRQILNWLPNVIAAGLVVLGGYAVAAAASRSVARAFERATGNRSRLAERTLRTVIIAGAAILALGQLGVETTILIVLTAGVVLAAALTAGLLAGLGGAPSPNQSQPDAPCPPTSMKANTSGSGTNGSPSSSSDLQWPSFSPTRTSTSLFPTQPCWTRRSASKPHPNPTSPTPETDSHDLGRDLGGAASHDHITVFPRASVRDCVRGGWVPNFRGIPPLRAVLWGGPGR